MTPDVRVVAVDLDVPAPTVSRFDRFLPALERDARARTRMLRAIAREVLADILGTPPDGLAITRQCVRCGHHTHGKPRVLDAPRVSFSVSSAGPLGMIAVGTGVAVGVDLEQVRARHNLAGLAARTLGAEQLQAWRATPEAEQLTHFLRIWTAKEAYLKAIGTGITRSLAEIPDEPAGWSVRPIVAPYGYVGALAVGDLSASDETAS